jgi:hypothetical protein
VVRTQIEAASVGLNCGPPFKAWNGTPSSTNVVTAGEVPVILEFGMSDV